MDENEPVRERLKSLYNGMRYIKILAHVILKPTLRHFVSWTVSMLLNNMNTLYFYPSQTCLHSCQIKYGYFYLQHSRCTFEFSLCNYLIWLSVIQFTLLFVFQQACDITGGLYLRIPQKIALTQYLLVRYLCSFELGTIPIQTVS